MRQDFLAFGAGVVFAVGLGISGMTDPSKVDGFLDIGGAWDPSLALVMVGGIGILAVAWVLTRRLRSPLLGTDGFPDPAPRNIDVRLVGGAAVFGMGWGLAGLCPAPAIVSLAAGTHAAFWFVPGMAAGIGGVVWFDLRRSRSAEIETGTHTAASVPGF